MDEQKETRAPLVFTAQNATGEVRRPKKWLAHAPHGSAIQSETGPHQRVMQGPGH